jgi:hypothetical protein
MKPHRGGQGPTWAVEPYDDHDDDDILTFTFIDGRWEDKRLWTEW